MNLCLNYMHICNSHVCWLAFIHRASESFVLKFNPLGFDCRSCAGIFADSLGEYAFGYGYIIDSRANTV
jgi:hypothetical protein